jgi:hypothetical protein
MQSKMNVQNIDKKKKKKKEWTWVHS